MLNSLASKFVGKVLPDFYDESTSDLINQLLPEIRQHMDKDTEVFLTWNVSSKTKGSPISIKAGEGIKVGDNSPLILDCALMGNTTNDPTPKLIANVEVTLASTVDLHMDSWVFFLSFPNVTVTKAVLRHSTIPMGSHVYSPVF